MSEYDVSPPPERLDERVQLRTAFSTHEGRVTRFLVQLEYWMGGEWRMVVRYDHDEAADTGHDTGVEGLHRDVYRDDEKYRTESVTGPIPPEKGFDLAEEDLRENLERFIKRFERWHDVNQ